MRKVETVTEQERERKEKEQEWREALSIQNDQERGLARLAPDEMRLIPKSRRGRNELDGLWALTARGLTRYRPTGAPTS